MMALHSKAPVFRWVEWNNKIFSKVRVVFGEPFLMLPKEEDKHIPREELLVLTNEILNKIYALIGQ